MLSGYGQVSVRLLAEIAREAGSEDLDPTKRRGFGVFAAGGNRLLWRRAVGVGDAVREHSDKVVGATGRGGLQRGVDVPLCASGRGKDTCHDGAVAPRQAPPSEPGGQQVDDTPRIEDQRIGYRRSQGVAECGFSDDRSRTGEDEPLRRERRRRTLSASKTFVLLIPVAIARRMIVSTCSSE